MSLPTGWVRAPLGDVVTETVDQGGPVSSEFTYVDISSIDNRTKRVTEPKSLAKQGAPSRARQQLQSGDVLVSMTRPNLNAVAIVPAEFGGLIGSTGFCVLRAHELEPRWLYYAVQLDAFIESMVALVQGALYPAVRPRDILAFEIPVPPIAEQRRIVAAIEEHLSRLDAAVTGLKRVQAMIPRYRAAVLKAATDGQLFGTEIDLAKWQTVTVQDLNPPGRPCAYGVLQPGPDVEDGVPFVRVGDIDAGRVDVTSLKRISPDIAAAYPRTRLRGGEVLLTLVGTIGRTAVVPESLNGANVARAVGVIPIRPDVRPAWVDIWFRNPARIREMTAKSHEVARKTLNLEDVRSSILMLPPHKDQDSICDEVERRFSLVEAVEQEVTAGLARADRLRQSILKRAFEGKLVPQDPNDEPASVLLERIRLARTVIGATKAKARRRKTRA